MAVNETSFGNISFDWKKFFQFARKDVHDKYPAMKAAWDQYVMIARMCEAQEEAERK